MGLARVCLHGSRCLPARPKPAIIDWWARPQLESALWAFVHMEQVEPTNRGGER